MWEIPAFLTIHSQSQKCDTKNVCNKYIKVHLTSVLQSQQHTAHHSEPVMDSSARWVFGDSTSLRRSSVEPLPGLTLEPSGEASGHGANTLTVMLLTAITKC